MEAPLDEKVKRVAIAICDEEIGPIRDNNGQCKACRHAQFDGDEFIERPDLVGPGCLGFGYAYLAEVAIAALDEP